MGNLGSFDYLCFAVLLIGLLYVLYKLHRIAKAETLDEQIERTNDFWASIRANMIVFVIVVVLNQVLG